MRSTIAERPLPHAVPLWLDGRAEPLPEATTGWPLLAMPVSTSTPTRAEDRVECFLSLDAHLVRNPESTFLARVAGEALADLGLHDGDLLVMDQATPPLAGNVALAVVEGAVVLVRLGRDVHGQWMVQPADPASPSRPLAEAVTITGVARWVIHRLWPGRQGAS